jgi:hypothetical protein
MSAGGNLGESFSLLLLICPVLVRGAALLAKALDCAVGCAAFGKCAAWVGHTGGLNMQIWSNSKIGRDNQEISKSSCLLYESGCLLLTHQFVLVFNKRLRPVFLFSRCGVKVISCFCDVCYNFLVCVKILFRFAYKNTDDKVLPVWQKDNSNIVYSRCNSSFFICS